MSVDCNCDQGVLLEMQKSEHSRCVLCGSPDGFGLGADFIVQPDNSVRAVINPGDKLQGYDGLVHGGIIALLLDGAMTHCLFAAGTRAVTGKLDVRYLHPVRIGRATTVTACIARSRPPLHMLEAEVAQDGQALVTATAKFMELQSPRRAGEDNGVVR